MQRRLFLLRSFVIPLVLVLVLVLVIALTGCRGGSLTAAPQPAPANGVLIVTETTCGGFHARFALLPDPTVMESDADGPTVRGVRWTMTVTPPAGRSGAAPVLTMESFTVRGSAGAHRFLHVSPPTDPAAPWRWSGTVGIMPPAGGVQHGDRADLFPAFSAGSPGLTVSWLGLDLEPQGGEAVAGAVHVAKPARCHNSP